MRQLLADTTPLKVSRDYRRLWFGLSVSNIGTQVTIVAVGLQIYAMTGSTLAVGLLGLSLARPARGARPVRRGARGPLRPAQGVAPVVAGAVGGRRRHRRAGMVRAGVGTPAVRAGRGAERGLRHQQPRAVGHHPAAAPQGADARGQRADDALLERRADRRAADRRAAGLPARLRVGVHARHGAVPRGALGGVPAAASPARGHGVRRGHADRSGAGGRRRATFRAGRPALPRDPAQRAHDVPRRHLRDGPVCSRASCGPLPASSTWAVARRPPACSPRPSPLAASSRVCSPAG